MSSTRVDELLAEVQAEVVGDDSFQVARDRRLARPQGQAPRDEIPTSDRFQVRDENDDDNDIDDDDEIVQAYNEDMTVEL